MANYRKGKKDPRGNSYDKRARKRWLLSPEAGFGGNGTTVPCVHCLEPLTKEECEADRKVPGGSYARSNIQPSCGPCNKERGDNESWIPPRLRVGVAA